MTDNSEKNRGQNPGQSGQQQQKNPQDVSKKEPAQEQGNQGQKDQGQRRAS